MKIISMITRNIPTLALATGLVCLGSGCASTGATGRKDAANITMPAPGKSRVVFVRPIPAGTGVTFCIHEGDRLIGVLPYKSYFVYDCEPGQRLFSTSMEDVAMLDADLLADRIYYVLVLPTPGWVMAQVDMFSMHPNSTAKPAKKFWKKLPSTLKSLRETVASPQDIENDRKGIAKYMERIQKYHREKYLPNPKRERILPEHGLTQPVRGR